MSITAARSTLAPLGEERADSTAGRFEERAATAPPNDSVRTPLRYLNTYRIIVAVFLGTIGTLNPIALGLGDMRPTLFIGASIAYVSAALVFHAILLRARGWFIPQLLVHVVVDVLVITLLMHASGGFRVGLGVLLLISLAGAALLANRRLTLFLASLATIAVLIEQSLRISQDASGNTAALFQAATLGVAYFVTALITNWLSRLASVHEEASRERAIELANQERINALVIQNVHDGVVVVDEEGVVRQLNRKAETLFDDRFGPGRPVRSYSQPLAGALAIWRTNPVDEPMPLELGAAAVRVRARFQQVGVHGRRFVLALLEDLSGLEAEAQSLKLMALGRLTANIAHEIRNPLSAITHASDLMLEENRSEGRERLARIIRDNAFRLDRMVKDVMELNRRDRVQSEPIPLHTFLTTFVEDLVRNEKLPADGLRIEAEQDLTVQFDRVHLHQILWNLVRNAWRYCRQEPGSVVLRLERVGPRVELSVIDDGSGVPPEKRTQLFEPFFTTDSRGTGLGLYISRELAGANGAQLDYQPRTPGSVFNLHWQGVKA